MQHPGRRHPALGGVQDKDDTAIALAVKLVLRAREHAPDPVEIVARREIVIGDKRRPLNHGAYAGMACKLDRHQAVPLSPAGRITPASAEATQSAMLASAGR